MADDVVAARAYIALFRKHTVPGTSFVDTSAGRRIELDDMTDDEALFVAKEFQRMEVAAAQRRRRRSQ